jgi:hypothetical protein
MSWGDLYITTTTTTTTTTNTTAAAAAAATSTTTTITTSNYNNNDDNNNNSLNVIIYSYSLMIEAEHCFNISKFLPTQYSITFQKTIIFIKRIIQPYLSNESNLKVLGNKSVIKVGTFCT